MFCRNTAPPPFPQFAMLKALRVLSMTFFFSSWRACQPNFANKGGGDEGMPSRTQEPWEVKFLGGWILFFQHFFPWGAPKSLGTSKMLRPPIESVFCYWNAGETLWQLSVCSCVQVICVVIQQWTLGHRLTGFQFSSVSYCHFSAIKKAGRSFFRLRKQAIL
jgi:hypothetical protein